MTEYEIKLVEMVREYDDQDNAVRIAIDVILKFLTQFESFPGQAADDPLESA